MKMWSVLLVQSCILIQVLDAELEVGCMPLATGGSCNTLSTNKALLNLGSSQLASEVHTAVALDNAGELDCQGDELRVKNLSVSVFPSDDGRKYNMLLQWEPDSHSSEGFLVEVKKTITQRILYQGSISTPGVSSLLLEKINFYLRNLLELTVRVKTLSTSHCTSLTVDVGRQCEAFVYNQHCSGRVFQSMVSRSEVIVGPPILEGEDSQLMTLHLSWQGVPDNVMVALTTESQSNTNCSKPGRNPPCFIAQNTNSITLTHLNASTSYSVIVHRFDPSPCLHPNLSHLFNGCGESCCTNNVIPVPVPAVLTPTRSVSNTYLPSTSSPESQLPFVTPSPGSQPLPLPESQASHIIPSPKSQVSLLIPSPRLQASPVTSSLESQVPTFTSSELLVTPSHSSSYTQSQESRGAVLKAPDDPNRLLALPIVVPLVIVVASVSFATLLVILYKHIRGKKRTPPASRVIPTTRTPEISSIVSLPDIELSNLANPLTTPCIDPSDTGYFPSKPLPQDSKPPPSVLVLYSPNTPKDEKEEILGLIVVGLCQFGIDAKSPDTCFNDSISVWLEKEVKTSTVLLVCNSALKADWENERPTQLICLLKQLLLGSLVEQGLSNYATVFLGSSTESSYVPTTYLTPQRQFVVRDFDDIVKISHFVHQIPLYTTAL